MESGGRGSCARILGGTLPSAQGGPGTTLPSDLLDQVRGRVKLLTLLLFVAFAFDPMLTGVIWLGARVTGGLLPADVLANAEFLWLDATGLVASAGLWREPNQSPDLTASIPCLGMSWGTSKSP